MVEKTARQADKSPQTAESLRDFARFCQLLRTEDGQPLELHAYERRYLQPYFDGTTETVVLLPKKNGKSTMLGALALYHAKQIPFAHVYMAARSRKQAHIMFDQAVGQLKRSGERIGSKLSYRLDGVQFDIKPGYSEIWCGESKIEVIAADVTTAEGVIPTLALVDELHRHSSSDLYLNFRDGLEARTGRMVTISTAGWDRESPLGRIRTKAHGLPDFKRTGTANRASTNGFAFFEWCLDDGDDIENLRLVKQANPAPWMTIARLRQRRQSPTMTLSQWTRMACGIWTHGEEPWLQSAAWDRMKIDVGLLEENEPVVGAVIYGQGAAIVLAAQRDDGGVVVKADIHDEDVPLSVVEQAIVALADRYDVQRFAHNTLVRSAEFLEDAGVPVEDFPMSPVRLQAATITLRRLIDDGLVHHDGDQRLRQHVLAGATKDSERGWRLMRTPETQGLIALAVATHLAMQQESAPAFAVL